MKTTNKPQSNLDDFVLQLSKGMEVWEDREIVIHHEPLRNAAIRWAIKCLANPHCEGSQEAINAIMDRRERISSDRPQMQVVEPSKSEATKFGVATKVVIRPYITVDAATPNEAAAKVYKYPELFRDQIIDDLFPVGLIEIDDVYQGAKRVDFEY